MNTILLLGAKSKLHPLESVPAELSRLKQLFSNTSKPEMEIEYEPYLTRPLLGDLLRRLTDQVGILHFAGHSGADQLQTDDDVVYAHHIADIIKTWHKKPTLLFLNGCNSAGQVDDFLQAGVLCVIATHNYIGDQQASQFAHEFYKNLLLTPDQTHFADAFARAGSLVLMGEARTPRSLDITALPQAPTVWDWGIFALDPATPARLTLSQTLETKISLPDFMTQAKLKMWQESWQRLFKIQAALTEEYNLETRSNERLRLEYLIQQKRKDLEDVEEKLAALTAQ